MVRSGLVATALWLGKRDVAATISQASGSKPGTVAQQAAQVMVRGRSTHLQAVTDLVLLLASDRGGNAIGADLVIENRLITTL
jgi:hypothetical protein